MGLYAPEEVPLNWYRYDITFSLELMDVFINNTEKQIKLSVQDYIEKRETHILEEHPEENYARIVDFHQGLDSETWDLEGLFKDYYPTLQRRSAFLTLYGFLEHELDKLCMIYKKTENYKIDFRDLKDLGIERSINYLEKIAKLPIEKGNDQWGKVRSIQKIRNLIVHNDGKLIDIDGNPRKTEQQIVADNKFLSGINEIIMVDGYLQFVLKSFGDLFIYLNDLIQNNGITKNAN